MISSLFVHYCQRAQNGIINCLFYIMNRKLFYNKILKGRVNSKVSLHLTQCPQTNLLSHHLTAHTYYFHIHPGLCIEFLYLHSSHRVRLSSTMLS